ncbi:pentatricopeptide repeat-containing protein At1g11290, chloroplastic [Aristolochia californica]|uniref:pentatricopeptide repeat-containing protein At1g11290, chloroplastic n=1 Tax=Aristolochia californica TaxID=171875 RepID=UPI0035D80B47
MASALKPFIPPPPAKSSFNDRLYTAKSSTWHRPHTHPSFSLLEICSNMKELNRILPLIIKSGLSDQPVFQTKLISLFSRFGCLPQAALVLDRVEDKSDELYHSVLKGHAHNSTLDDGFLFFTQMRLDGVQPVVYNFTYLLKTCGDNFDLTRGKVLHALSITSGFGSNVFAMTAVVNMYAKCRQINESKKVFDRMFQRDLVSWNAIIAAYAQNGLSRRALDMVIAMQDEWKRPDLITLVTILPACADFRFAKLGKSIHAYAMRCGFEMYVNISTALVDMYSKCGLLGTARLVFDRMSVRNVVSWNSMIDGYAQNDCSEEAMKIFRMMLDKGVRPTDVTIMAALGACADLGDLDQGRLVHELLIEVGLESDVSVMNSLITMYSRCRRVDLAAEIFESLKGKTLVSWNAMILGFAQNECPYKALNLFCNMQKKHTKPDSFTLVSVIPAVAYISILRQAKWIHGYVMRSCLLKNVYVMTALVDMYAKCGGVIIARRLFDMMEERHLITWNAMIDGYGTHGQGKAAIELFEEMIHRSPVKPNDVTFLIVLSACSHSGLVDEGLHYFACMKRDYGFEPSMDHYGSMVDLLGRAGRLEEAWNFIEGMPMEPGISVYGAMLGACKIHQNVELGEKAGNALLNLEPEDGGYYVLLANMYATASMWNEVAKVRTNMEKKGVKKNPGISCIQFKNKVHTFYSGCTNHPQSKEIYTRLEILIDEIKAAGYVPDTSSIHDVEDDVKVQLLSSHSEKLAISFGLISSAPGTTIQIRKNLRVCGDCHNATKFISLVTGREIIVRDMQRFHHFKDGHCSCRDYW